MVQELFRALCAQQQPKMLRVGFVGMDRGAHGRDRVSLGGGTQRALYRDRGRGKKQSLAPVLPSFRPNPIDHCANCSRALLPLVARAPLITAVVAGGYVGSTAATLAALHPLEYVAMNALAGGTRGAYDRFELDYWSAAATEAVRRLEHRLEYDPAIRWAESPPRILICIGTREERVHPILRRPWLAETDPEKVIATQRSRCAENKPVVLIDEVKRVDRTFAWTYSRKK
jgi:hypothetical protein